jgi:hypothetical protein
MILERKTTMKTWILAVVLVAGFVSGSWAQEAPATFKAALGAVDGRLKTAQMRDIGSKMPIEQGPFMRALAGIDKSEKGLEKTEKALDDLFALARTNQEKAVYSSREALWVLLQAKDKGRLREVVDACEAADRGLL